jgi:hypothetical protein
MKEKKKMIKRQELVNDILDLYDYIDVLELENERLKNNIPKVQTKEKSVSPIDALMIREGKKKVFKEVVYSWNHVDCKYDEEADTYNFTSYDNWLERKINYRDIPDSMSRDDFITYYRAELLEMYSKEKEESFKEAKENE